MRAKITVSPLMLKFSFILTLIFLHYGLDYRSVAQAKPKLCLTKDKYEPASKTYRTARLPEFRIEVDIPSNYKTMKRRDGSVWIVHRIDFEHLQCIAKGGGGGRGLYYEDISLIDRDRSATLKDQAIKLVGNSSNLSGIRLLKYQKNNISGYLIDIPSPTFNHAAFVGTIKGWENKVLRIDASCDCDTKLKDVQGLLNRIRVLQ